MANGARLSDTEVLPKRLLIDQPGVTDALQFVADLRHRWRVMPSADEVKEQGDPQQLFIRGRIAMWFGEATRAPSFATQIKDFAPDVAVPARGKQLGTWRAGAGLTVSRAGKQPDAACRVRPLLRWDGRAAGHRQVAAGRADGEGGRRIGPLPRRSGPGRAEGLAAVLRLEHGAAGDAGLAGGRGGAERRAGQDLERRPSGARLPSSPPGPRVQAQMTEAEALLRQMPEVVTRARPRPAADHDRAPAGAGPRLLRQPARPDAAPRPAGRRGRRASATPPSPRPSASRPAPPCSPAATPASPAAATTPRSCRPHEAHLPGLLAGAGYACGLFGKNHCFPDPAAAGFAEVRGEGELRAAQRAGLGAALPAPAGADRPRRPRRPAPPLPLGGAPPAALVRRALPGAPGGGARPRQRRRRPGLHPPPPGRSPPSPG